MKIVKIDNEIVDDSIKCETYQDYLWLKKQKEFIKLWEKFVEHTPNQKLHTFQNFLKFLKTNL